MFDFELIQYSQLKEFIGYLDPIYAINQWGPTAPQCITVMSIILFNLLIIITNNNDSLTDDEMES